MEMPDLWEPTLAAALLGAERATVAVADPLADLVAEAEPGAALLARLAARGLHHRAGLDLASEALAPLDQRPTFGPECPPAAATRLHGLLVAGRNADDRVGEWFDLAAAAGMRPPAWLHQALMLRRATLPAAAEAVVGAELAWLARACGEGPSMAQASSDWTEGNPVERRAAFIAFRLRDPDGARAALEPVFRKEKADLRETLVDGLEAGLSSADEPFLETCLDDRAGGVRAAARRLLPRLTGSRYAARMTARAQSALTIESRRGLLGKTTHTLAVTLPEGGPELARDGVEPHPRERPGGVRTGLLRAILARAPLQAFAGHPPRLWIELALGGEWAEPVFGGLLETIARQRDPAWIEATVDVLDDACAGKVSGLRRNEELLTLWVRALDLLPDATWEAWVGDLIRTRKIEPVLAALGQGPEAFSETFGAALLDWLAFVGRGSDTLRRDLAKAGIVARLGDRLRPGEDNAAAAAILARLPEEAGDPLRPQVARLAETLDLRAAMRRDFRPDTTTKGIARE